MSKPTVPYRVPRLLVFVVTVLGVVALITALVVAAGPSELGSLVSAVVTRAPGLWDWRPGRSAEPPVQAPAARPAVRSSGGGPPTVAGSTSTATIEDPDGIDTVGDGRWIAQLASISEAETADGRAQLDRVREQVPGVRVLRSSDFGSLEAGYLVLYHPGPFTSGEQALSFCAQRGRTTSAECVGRFVSSDPADRSRQVHPS